MRYELGPVIDGTFPLPSIHGDLTDPEVGVTAKKARKAGGGKIHLDLGFQFPAYTPGEHNQLVEVHAVAFPPGVAIPTEAEEIIEADQPKVKADASNHTDGSELSVTIPNVTPGSLKVATVLGFADTTPDPDPSSTVPETPATQDTVTESAPSPTVDSTLVADPSPVVEAHVVAPLAAPDPSAAAPADSPPSTS